MQELIKDIKPADTDINGENNMNKKFVAINYITCKDEYKKRFEQLFASRAKAIDRMPGFHDMQVLKPTDGNVYLIVSQWDSPDAFRNWTKSPEFIEGHKRGFEDIKKYKEEGKEPPMSSDFKTYQVIAQ
ncbi:MAG: antibiotic biosynthesis monooxygenase [Ignavibacteria bacterium]|nr:antibiotic biosynthesis monooxygenase [Ignavibacteria bacterium]